jgi:hypothetical protein
MNVSTSTLFSHGLKRCGMLAADVESSLSHSTQHGSWPTCCRQPPLIEHSYRRQRRDTRELVCLSVGTRGGPRVPRRNGPEDAIYRSFFKEGPKDRHLSPVPGIFHANFTPIAELIISLNFALCWQPTSTPR